ncbi:MAG: hypothetical protein V1721_06350 [Pseudomonadota bacterium]
MKKALLATFMAGAMCCGSLIAHAQTGQAPQQPTASQMVMEQLDDRFDKCLKDTSCSSRERLQILLDMEGEIGQSLRKISQACAVLNFTNCIDPQTEDIRQWHAMHDRMQQMMRAIETQALSEREPAAGEATERQGKWWRRVWPQPIDR